jgi:diguanylate cyclase (GGDEF)-like protein
MGMILDGVFASEAIDSSGEVVKIDGMDISSMQDGESTANYEHHGKDNDGDGTETVGRIVYVRKIFELNDCEDDRQKFYFRKMGEIPYLYGMVRLLDAAGHPGAESLAAQIRDAVAHDEKILVRYSVEGTTLEREGNVLKASIGRKVAMTLGPCNKTCFSGIIVDPHAPDGFSKHPQDVLKADLFADPTSTKLGGSQEYESNPIVADIPSPVNRLIKNLQLLKTLTAGSIVCSPDTLSGGAALQREDLRSKYKRHIVDAIKKYRRPFNKAEFRRYLKAELQKADLPEVSDSYLDYFVSAAHDFSVKKSLSSIQISDLPLSKINRLEETLFSLRKGLRESLQGYGVSIPEVHQVKIKIGTNFCPAGRFAVVNGVVHHLEDYYGLLSSVVPEGPADFNLESNLHGLEKHPNFQIAQHNFPEPPQEIQVAQQSAPPRPAVFEYSRPGMDQPHIIEFSLHGAALDGVALTPDELHLVLENAKSGLATLKWRPNSASLTKGEHPGNDVEESLRALDASAAAGHIDQSHAKNIRKWMMEDLLVPGVGNKFAFKLHQQHNLPGVVGSVDLNNFKTINDTHGHIKGDEAIGTIGGALRSAADKTGNMKLFRTGGDEFVVHAPDEGTMHQFVRHARNHMEGMPLVHGTHKPSFSIGIGNDYAGAETALKAAKANKVDPVSQKQLYHPHNTPSFAHSAIPGSEGPIKLSE